MSPKAGALVVILIGSLFMGVTAISVGFGAAFPPLNLIAKPFVCPAGKKDLSERTYNPYPGNTTTTITWYCTDEATGTKTELGIFPMALYAGVIYGLLLFVVIVGFMFIHSKRTSPTAVPAHNGAGQTSWDNTFFDQAQQSQHLLHFNVQAKHFIQLLSFILTRMPLPG